MGSRRKRVWLVQRGVWDMELESMPLAAAYLKAVVDADPALRSEIEVRIVNFKGGARAIEMARRLFFSDGVPDVLGFSVLGWNYDDFGKLGEVFRQVNPEGWTIFGGNHVSNQAARVFSMFPAVDIVVNGEGELTFADLMRASLAGRSRHELHDVQGISFKEPDGTIANTPERPRIADLDIIPSPLLTGAIDLRDPYGNPVYDVALMESNRGCPYKCSFCYWGGAIGQRLRKFSTDRLAAELDVIGYQRIPDVVLCDANFGMLPEDEQFLDLLIATREKYGYPRNLETSWAKNKSRVFYSIVERMHEVGLRSSFTLALQSAAEPALRAMRRKNMKVNQWRDLADWLQARGMESYAELIWGIPGETYESFLEGYDQFARYVSRIAIYPLLLMPNTAFAERREDYGFRTLRGEGDDFEYVLAHETMSLEDNRRMHRFLFWARVVAENQIFRHIWAPLHVLEDITQSSVLLSLDEWFEARDDECSSGLRACRDEMVDHLDASRVTRGLIYFYTAAELGGLLHAWWHEAILPRVRRERRGFFADLFRYDLLTRPVYRPRSSAPEPGADHDDAGNGELSTEVLYDATHYVRPGVTVEYDIPGVVAAIRAGRKPALTRSPETIDLYYRHGFAVHIDNHEFVSRYVGKTRAQIDAENESNAQDTIRTLQSGA